jgi:hypothetical protein
MFYTSFWIISFHHTPAWKRLDCLQKEEKIGNASDIILGPTLWSRTTSFQWRTLLARHQDQTRARRSVIGNALGPMEQRAQVSLLSHTSS